MTSNMNAEIAANSFNNRTGLTRCSFGRCLERTSSPIIGKDMKMHCADARSINGSKAIALATITGLYDSVQFSFSTLKGEPCAAVEYQHRPPS